MEYDASDMNTSDRNWHVLTISAKSLGELSQLSQRYEKFLAESSVVSFADICFTANILNTHFEHRLAICAQTTKNAYEQLVSQLEDLNAGDYDALFKTNPHKRIAFLFTGAGSQYVGMGRQLYNTQPDFRRIVNECDAKLKSLLNVSLLDVLYPSNTSKNAIDEIIFTQIAIFVIEVALASLWDMWGIKPDVVMGHSLGEYAAACIAGVFSIEDGLKIVAERGRLMQALPDNVEMFAVFANEETVRNILDELLEHVSIAVDNGPKNVVVSGQVTFMQLAKDRLLQNKIDVQKLNVARAGHSKEMEPMLEDFRKVIEKIPLSPPRVELISNVTGCAVGDEITTPEYWCQHLRQTVRFRKGMETLATKAIDIFVEIGSKPMLLVLGRQCMSGKKAVWIPSLSQGQEDWQIISSALSELYLHGIKISWEKFDQGYARQILTMPGL